MVDSIIVVFAPTGREAAMSFVRQYAEGRPFGDKYSKDREKLEAMLASDDPVSRATVNAVIGNETWTKIRCEGCGMYVDKAARMGSNGLSVESSDPDYCLSCLRVAVEKLEAVKFEAPK